jgi:Pirin C-terminal cupin domain
VKCCAAKRRLRRFSREGNFVLLQAKQDAQLLVRGGEPFDVPVASYNPFVMNTREEMMQASEDYRPAAWVTSAIFERWRAELLRLPYGLEFYLELTTVT